MLYKLAHFLKDNLSFLWLFIEGVNSLLFQLRYGSKKKSISTLLNDSSIESFSIREANSEDASSLASFFAKQPEKDFTYFRPHGFSEKDLKVLIDRKSFLMYVVEEQGMIVGYFFLRSFFHGQCYLGKMVDHEHQGQGIGKLMCKAAMDIATTLGLRMFESINKENVASMKSSSVLKQVIVKELKDGDLLIEDLPGNM